MTDTSDAKPAGGNLLPLMPPEWSRRDGVLASVCAALDGPFDTARTDLGTLLSSHQVTAATGADLDALGALVGLPRRANEADGDCRIRIQAVMRQGVQASPCAAMAAYLTAQLALPATVVQGAAATSSFVATVLGNPGPSVNVPALIRQVKAAGTVFTAQAVVPSGGTDAGGRLGERRLAEGTVGGGRALVSLGS